MGIDIIFHGNGDAKISYGIMQVPEEFPIPSGKYNMYRCHIDEYRFVEIKPQRLFPDEFAYQFAAMLRARTGERESNTILIGSEQKIPLPDYIRNYLKLDSNAVAFLIANINCFNLWNRQDFDRHFSETTKEEIEAADAWVMEFIRQSSSPPARSYQHSPSS